MWFDNECQYIYCHCSNDVSLHVIYNKTSKESYDVVNKTSYIFFIPLQREGRSMFSHSLKASANQNQADLDFLLTSLWNEPISSKINARYASYPVSANAEVIQII